MSIIAISQEQFFDLNVQGAGSFPEKSWFKSTEIGLAGATILDPFDKDWSYIIVKRERDGVYRAIDHAINMTSQQEAEMALTQKMQAIEDDFLKDMPF